jgi:hypothetical protein
MNVISLFTVPRLELAVDDPRYLALSYKQARRDIRINQSAQLVAVWPYQVRVRMVD